MYIVTIPLTAVIVVPTDDAPDPQVIRDNMLVTLKRGSKLKDSMSIAKITYDEETTTVTPLK